MVAESIGVSLERQISTGHLQLNPLLVRQSPGHFLEDGRSRGRLNLGRKGKTLAACYGKAKQPFLLLNRILPATSAGPGRIEIGRQLFVSPRV